MNKKFRGYNPSFATIIEQLLGDKFIYLLISFERFKEIRRYINLSGTQDYIGVMYTYRFKRINEKLPALRLRKI